jgi:hypothetical protein
VLIPEQRRRGFSFWVIPGSFRRRRHLTQRGATFRCLLELPHDPFMVPTGPSTAYYSGQVRSVMFIKFVSHFFGTFASNLVTSAAAKQPNLF